MKKKVIGFVHTHWDREWYREFEVFRLRLLRVFDNTLEMLVTGKLPSFYFDGQTSALQDYLEMRPDKLELVKKLIKEKRLFIGPFYCLIDEFLTDENAFRKNLDIGLKYAKDMGCKDFIAYFADTFGHTPNLIPILKEYDINTAVVWRGCGEIPSEFTWGVDDGINKDTINTINLVRGYFNDFLTADMDIDKKAKYIEENLDKIAKYSLDTLLMPIGGDHLGVNEGVNEGVNNDLLEILSQVNERLENYEIEIGTIFDYINLVKNNFKNFEHIGELRDNSKTFTLQGSFSSRLDLKRLNIETSHLLDKADKFRNYFTELSKNYEKPIEYAYTLLLQNQAHDSIYGCALDDVHRENIIRYKKIQQIANTIIDEIKYIKGIKEDEIINLGYSNPEYKEFESVEKLPDYQLLETKMGFEKELLTNTLKVPVTEDYREIYTYLGKIENNKIVPLKEDTDVFVTDKCIGNSKIFLSIEDNKIKIGEYELKFVDFIDNGDSYNEGPIASDRGKWGKLISFKKLYEGTIRSALEFKIDINDILNVIVELDNQSELLQFKINWNNTYTNHNLQVVFDTNKKITQTYSEDINKIIKREFNPDYDIRKNLPKEKGIEVKNNTAPMQHGVWTNGIGVVTCGLTQYEIRKTELAIPILRSTDVLSNPKNPARTTPAGPPIKLDDLMQLGKNNVKFAVFIGENNKLKENIDKIFNYIV